jgi:hypothetical protein
VQPEWKGFGIRLGRAIDRWPGGGQRAFVAALRDHATQEGINIPTSYRTLINYMSGRTTPPESWVRAAATVLRWRPEYLLTGEGPEREGETDTGFTMSVSADAGPRMSALNRLFVNAYVDIPFSARLFVLRFLMDYFSNDDQWDDLPQKSQAVNRVLREYFAPLLTRQTMSDPNMMALTASLTAAAYVRLAAGSPHRAED